MIFIDFNDQFSVRRYLFNGISFWNSFLEDVHFIEIQTGWCGM